MSLPPATTPASTTTSAEPPAASTTSTTLDSEPTTGDVEGFEVIEVEIDGESMAVAIADTPELRQQGLMFVEDLGDLDGMLFDFGAESQGAFSMKNTLIPLDIAFFDGDGALVAVLTMVPCEADPCPTYDPEVPYSYAVEVPAGVFGDLPDHARLSF